MTDDRTKNIVVECKRQEESCLYTSTALYEWVKFLRPVRMVFVVAPILLGAVATMPLLEDSGDYKWLTGICAFIAGLFPAVYKALDFDVSLDAVGKHAHQFKVLQDRFRQAADIVALEPFDELQKTFADLMDRMDAARETSPTYPERFFEKARKKINAGHYSFAADAASRSGQNGN